MRTNRYAVRQRVERLAVTVEADVDLDALLLELDRGRQRARERHLRGDMAQMSPEEAQSRGDALRARLRAG